MNREKRLSLARFRKARSRSYLSRLDKGRLRQCICPAYQERIAPVSDCVFCRIVAGDIPAHIVHQDDQVVAIMDIGHVNPGHTLVLSRRHVATIEDASEDLAAHAFRIANRVARALNRALPSEGMTILQANRPAGFQTVAHFHLHVLPRNEGDGVDLTWPAKSPSQDQLADYAARLRVALAEIKPS